MGFFYFSMKSDQIKQYTNTARLYVNVYQTQSHFGTNSVVGKIMLVLLLYLITLFNVVKVNYMLNVSSLECFPPWLSYSVLQL